MNILILTTHLNPGGISRYVINLAQGLKKRKHNVFIASAGGEWAKIMEEKQITHKNIPIKTKSILSPKIFFSFIKLAPLIIKKKIEIIHANTRVTQALAAIISRLTSLPYISSFHGYYLPNLFRKIFKFPGQKTIAVSNAVKKHLTQDLKIKEDKINVVYNGLDTKSFTRGKNKNKTAAGFKESDFLIGILGRISEEKGHFLAVNTIKELSLKYPHLFLIISGTGKLEQSLKDYTVKIGVSEKVKFINWPAPDFLDILDLLIMPSKKEGFGYSIIEAFIKNVPVIGFNVGGIPEIINDNVNGLLFYEYTPQALRKPIEKIIKDKSLREQIIKKANIDGQAYSIERMAQETEAVYLKIIRTKKKKPPILKITGIALIFIFLSLAIYLNLNYATPILMYHSIDKNKVGTYAAVSEEIFHKQMRFIKEKGYRTLTFSQYCRRLKNNEKISRNTIVITFDDGYKDNLKAVKILKNMQIPATIFLITDNIGKTGYLSKKDIADFLENSPVEIASHTLTHKYLPTETEQNQKKEIFDSKKQLEDTFDREIKTISYPIGAFNEQTLIETANADYLCACTTNRGFSQKRNIFALRRIKISNKDNNFKLWVKLSGFYNVFRKVKQPY